MKKLFKVLVVVLAAAVALCFVGCKNAAEDSGSGDSTTASYLTFKGNDSFTLAVDKKNWNGTVEWSTDGTTWTVWDGKAIPSVANCIYLRGKGNKSFATSGMEITRFKLRGIATKVECTGNIMTLLDYENPPTAIKDDYCFCGLFTECSARLTKAPELPATTLAKYCYNGMFSGCAFLTAAPALPATTLTEYCYDNMFFNCSSLTSTPALPATTLTEGCYNYMFFGCTSLTSIGKIAEGNKIDGVKDCFVSMFDGRSANSIITTTAGDHFVSFGAIGTNSSSGSSNAAGMFNGDGTYNTPSDNTAYKLK